jgi:hypothetical protein
LTSFNYLVAQFPRQYLCETAKYRPHENARHNKQDARQAGIDNWRATARICRFARVHFDWNHFQQGTPMPARILGEPYAGLCDQRTVEPRQRCLMNQ